MVASGGTIWTAWVGDSRAVIGGTKVSWLMPLSEPLLQSACLRESGR